MTEEEAGARMTRLIGAPVRAEWKPMPYWYELTTTISGQRMDWCMVSEDFDYTDAELMEKFVNPIRSVVE